jgi:hypothetical protein
MCGGCRHRILICIAQNTILQHANFLNLHLLRKLAYYIYAYAMFNHAMHIHSTFKHSVRTPHHVDLYTASTPAAYTPTRSTPAASTPTPCTPAPCAQKKLTPRSVCIQAVHTRAEYAHIVSTHNVYCTSTNLTVKSGFLPATKAPISTTVLNFIAGK